MRTFLITAATAIAALTAASPAAAQYYPQPRPVPYGYGQPGYGQPGYGQPGYGQPNYGNGYGNQYRDQQGLVRSYMIRADQLRQRIERNDNRDRISEREAYRLRSAATDLQQRTRAYAQNGLSDSERRDLDVRLARLEQSLRYERRDGNGNGRNNGNGWNNGDGNGWNRDRDRDGRDDRADPFVDRNGDGLDDRTGRRPY